MSTISTNFSIPKTKDLKKKMAHVIIGTAGHIDHGKSALVKALTGTDPDRLQEEKYRGLTIDLGFAFLSDDIAIIDVPGHEKFIKNMVAGVSTIDFAMLVVAADDGVMPQTREHFDILKLLNVQKGIIVISKCDLVDADFLELVKEDVRDLTKTSFLKDADLFTVSSLTGEGIEPLRSYLHSLSREIKPRPDQGLFWMPVDRSFSIKGFGTVVTGSILSGSIRLGDTVERLPDRLLKVRNLERHGERVEQIGTSERAAVNLHNIAKNEIKRGDVLATPHYFSPSARMDAKLTLLESAPRPLKSRTRVRLHLGTQQVFARLKLLSHERLHAGEQGFIQLQIESKAAARRLDAFVIRQYSPAITIGGGIILDVHAAKQRRFDKERIEQLQKLEKQDAAEIISLTLLNNPFQCYKPAELAQESGLPAENSQSYIQKLIKNNIITALGSGRKTVLTHTVYVDKLKEKMPAVLRAFHQQNPLKAGMDRAELKENCGSRISTTLFDHVLSLLSQENQIETEEKWIKLAGHRIELSPPQKQLAEKLEHLLLETPFSTPSVQEMAHQTHTAVQESEKILGALQGQNKVIRVEGDIYFHHKAVDQAEQMLIDLAQNQEELSVSQFREMLNTSRKYAMGLLNFFDTKGLTERVGDNRVIHYE